ncbi:SH3 domain-binding glutamic acid-rich-like protein 3 [Syngnathus scovelli]|uniref:SH3 domain-binding glutamic acid-rich-like protein 3 n=1 Tax=Syngnathus scovelli TaxID=161590 RepID=UPI00211039F3|nr:SH3 domain-binding glutamic acid-rich-like protein 3 [Syngnathus scovelli]
MSVKVFYASVSGNLEIKTAQQRIFSVLDGKRIPYEMVDITASDEAKASMRSIAGNPTALPPQISNGNAYCGDFSAFEAAVESEALEAFLKL